MRSGLPAEAWIVDGLIENSLSDTVSCWGCGAPADGPAVRGSDDAHADPTNIETSVAPSSAHRVARLLRS
jgi:hypothetical protein